MFTGIIEALGTVAEVVYEGSNVHFWIESTLTSELKIDQSVAHNGVCLTVVALRDGAYRVTAIEETLSKTNLGVWRTGTVINLERAMLVGARLDGHFVQGHVDTTALCIAKEILDGSWKFQFEFPEAFASLVIEKGSICINGVSLTVFDIGRQTCTVAIIPYTFIHTNFHFLEVGHRVNMEFDVLGKYLLRQTSLQTMSQSFT